MVAEKRTTVGKGHDKALAFLKAAKVTQTPVGVVTEAVPRTPTGLLALDNILGWGPSMVDGVQGMVPGLPRARMMEIFGREGAAKSTVAAKVCAYLDQRWALKSLYVDTEHALDWAYMDDLGIRPYRGVGSKDPWGTMFFQPDTMENALDIVVAGALSGDFRLVVVDSVAGLVPKAELDGEMADVTVGLHPRLLGKAVRKILDGLDRTGTTVWWINQVREKIGGQGKAKYGPQEVPPGGRTLKFFSSIRMKMTRVQGIPDDDSIDVQMALVKQKTSKAQGGAVRYRIYPGSGPDMAEELVLLGLQTELVENRGAWWYIGGEKVAQGRDNLKQMLTENEEAAGLLRKDIEEKLRP